jgi:hypothetical protein
MFELKKAKKFQKWVVFYNIACYNKNVDRKQLKNNKSKKLKIIAKKSIKRFQTTYNINVNS